MKAWYIMELNFLNMILEYGISLQQNRCVDVLGSNRGAARATPATRHLFTTLKTADRVMSKILSGKLKFG